jgi:hypothetical protein
MSAWLFEVADIIGGLAFAISVLFFLISLLIKFQNKDATNSTVKDIIKLLESEENQDRVGVTVSVDGATVFLTNFPIQVKRLYFQLEDRHEGALRELGRLKEAYSYMSWAAGAGILAFVVFRLIHFV